MCFYPDVLGTLDTIWSVLCFFKQLIIICLGFIFQISRFSVFFSLMFCRSCTTSLVLAVLFPNAGHSLAEREGSVNRLCSGRH